MHILCPYRTTVRRSLNGDLLEELLLTFPWACLRHQKSTNSPQCSPGTRYHITTGTKPRCKMYRLFHNQYSLFWVASVHPTSGGELNFQRRAPGPSHQNSRSLPALVLKKKSKSQTEKKKKKKKGILRRHFCTQLSPSEDGKSGSDRPSNSSPAHLAKCSCP